jgi:hypothetical protein
MVRASTTAQTKVSQSGVFIARHSKDNQSSGLLDVPVVASRARRAFSRKLKSLWARREKM